MDLNPFDEPWGDARTLDYARPSRQAPEARGAATSMAMRGVYTHACGVGLLSVSPFVPLGLFLWFGMIVMLLFVGFPLFVISTTLVILEWRSWGRRLRGGGGRGGGRGGGAAAAGSVAVRARGINGAKVWVRR